MVVVIGGGYAGRMAAVRLRAAGVAVTLVDPLDAAVERTRLHEAAARGTDTAIPLGPWLAGIGAVHLRARAVGIDSDRVHTDDGRAVQFEQLVVTAGSLPAVSGIPGGEHAVPLGSPADAARIYGRLGELPPGAPVGVVGAGLTGIEIAAEIAEARPDLRVALIGPVEGYSPRGARILTDGLAELGVRCVDTRATAIDARGIDTPLGRVDAALVVWAGGMRAPGWLGAAGLPVDAAGRVRVDPALVVEGRDGVVAAGDCAATGLRMACATAMPTGCHAADTILRLRAGEAPRPMSFGYPGRCVSLGRRRALWQGTRTDDAPTWALGGRGAVLVKETILWAVARMHRWESDVRVPLYGWRRGGGAALIPDTATASSPQP